jgi:hypothetical protein
LYDAIVGRLVLVHGSVTNGAMTCAAGAHHAAFAAICDTLERELSAERAILAGAER